ncbi:MAG: pyruvate formate lyase family protein [Planctomycetota bacterium]|nr:pyruvate formate lyase family protein [Planctomycetota bacterium]
MTTTFAEPAHTTLLESLDSLEEYFAAGFMSAGDLDAVMDSSVPVVARMANGIRHHLENCPLPPYNGEVYYPNGCSFWDNGAAVWHHYVKVSYDRNRLAAKRELASGEEEHRALDALEAFWETLPGAGGYTHSIPNYGRLLAEGLRGYEDRILEGRRRAQAQSKADSLEFYESLLIVIDGVRTLIRRMTEKLSATTCETPQQDERRKWMLEALEIVPEHRPRSFYQAMVATHFFFTLDGCDDLGRFDQDLLPYYRSDRDACRLKREDALELIRALWKHVDDSYAWNCALGGTGPDGEDATNELTILALEAGRSRRRPNLALRLRKDTPDEIWDTALDTISTGCGLPALYCEENYLESLREAGLEVPNEDITKFAFGGCTETMIHGCSNVGSLDAGINLPAQLVKSLHADLEGCETFDEFSECYREQLRREVRRIVDSVNASQETKASHYPQLIRSLLIDDCIDSGVEYAAGGARYNWSVINIEGLANVIDSLCAVRETVFETQEISPSQLLAALRDDFNGHDQVKKRLEQCPRYGNGDERADSVANEISSFVFTEFLHRRPWRGGRFLPSCLMFTTYARAGEDVGATPDGRHSGAPIADSAGAYHGRDCSGPTALLRSVVSLDQIHAPGTLVVNIRFSKKLFREAPMREKLKALIKTYFQLGGMQIQINVVDQAVLRDAFKHPERHEDLIIRIGGFSEYWNRLSRELQLTVLERTEHE